ncbi:MAG TPA: hypothetical protein VNH15_02165 [Elusimicrobiota bacterium]|nr:hypothetical protein [Elusimicrobiota bacterium]
MKRFLRLGAFLIVAAFLGACGKTDWLARLHSEPMYQRANQLRASSGCTTLVPAEFGQMLPVPMKRGSGFAVLFYPLESSPGHVEALTPIVKGLFGAGREADSCAKIAGVKLRALGPPVPLNLSNADYYRQQERVFSSLNLVADAYWQGGKPNPAEKKQVNEFAQAFSAVAEPPLLPYYYRLNPDFWEWIEKQAGYSIPKT